MAIQNFDQLNSMSTKWFNVMNIPIPDIMKRINASLDYCEIMIMLFLMITEEGASREESKAFARERLIVLAENQIDKEDMAYINDWAEKESENIVDDTFKMYEETTSDNYEPTNIHLEQFDIDMPKDEYVKSEERALLTGIRLATTVYNFKEYLDAVEKGYKRKIWVTEEDDKVRETHQEMAGVDIPINELFVVGNSYMLMPGDVNNGAELQEIINCRCHLIFY